MGKGHKNQLNDNNTHTYVPYECLYTRNVSTPFYDNARGGVERGGPRLLIFHSTKIVYMLHTLKFAYVCDVICFIARVFALLADSSGIWCVLYPVNV